MSQSQCIKNKRNEKCCALCEVKNITGKIFDYVSK